MGEGWESLPLAAAPSAESHDHRSVDGRRRQEAREHLSRHVSPRHLPRGVDSAVRPGSPAQKLALRLPSWSFHGSVHVGSKTT